MSSESLPSSGLHLGEPEVSVFEPGARCGPGPACQHVAWVSVLTFPSRDRRGSSVVLAGRAEPPGAASCRTFKGLRVTCAGDVAAGGGDRDGDKEASL